MITTLLVAQEIQLREGEMELGGGLHSFGVTDGFYSAGIAGIQAQIDYDFLKGPYRAAFGAKVIAFAGYTYLYPGIKLGKDIINLNVSVALDGLTHYGLSSRIDLTQNKQHAINISLQVASDVYDYSYASLFLGYSYRLN